MKKLILNAEVVNDLRSIYDFIAADNPKAATKLIHKFYEQFENLQAFLSMGSSLQKRVSRKTDYRYFVYNEYLIFYKDCPEHIAVYRILNRYRDIFSILFDKK